jgi:hypothetical protein
MSKKIDDMIVRKFFKFEHELKLFHWRTYSYAKHKASDKLFNKIIDQVDTFIETYMGKIKKRVDFDSNEALIIDTYNDKNIDVLLQDFKTFLVDIDKKLPRHSSDLLNIRDEMLGNINRTIYLFSLQ